MDSVLNIYYTNNGRIYYARIDKHCGIELFEWNREDQYYDKTHNLSECERTATCMTIREIAKTRIISAIFG